MVYRFLALFAVLLFSYPALAQPLNVLAGTDLYTKIVHSCQPLALQGWRHPVRNVLESEGIIIDKVELCNNKTFPVFTVQLKYDPRTSDTDSFFNKLYLNLTTANGWWPYAIVDETDDVVITVITNKANHSFNVSLQDYSQTPSPGD